ncbi:3542_t:CDS:2, partial [Cetraspora pellucida]
LTRRVFCITTDNGTNIKKSIRLMNNIRQSACSAYMLQLSVLKGLKPVAQLIKCAKNLILFFSQSLKQTERLNNAQEKCCYTTIYQVIEDQLLDSLILLLKLFYDATTVFSGSNYPMFNLIYPTMKLLIKKFASSDSQTEDDYADLLFGPRKQISDQSQFIADTKDLSKSDIEYEYKAPKLPITSVELHNLVKATSYFSFQEYWKVLNEIGLIASFLDPQIKNLKFINDEKISRDDNFVESSNILTKLTIINNLMTDLYSNEELGSVSEESEIDHYI